MKNRGYKSRTPSFSYFLRPSSGHGLPHGAHPLAQWCGCDGEARRPGEARGGSAETTSPGR